MQNSSDQSIPSELIANLIKQESSSSQMQANYDNLDQLSDKISSQDSDLGDFHPKNLNQDTPVEDTLTDPSILRDNDVFCEDESLHSEDRDFINYQTQQQLSEKERRCCGGNSTELNNLVGKWCKQTEIDFFKSSKPRIIFESKDDDDSFEVKSSQFEPMNLLKSSFKDKGMSKDSCDGISSIRTGDDKNSAGDLDVLSLLNKKLEEQHEEMQISGVTTQMSLAQQIFGAMKGSINQGSFNFPNYSTEMKNENTSEDVMDQISFKHDDELKYSDNQLVTADLSFRSRGFNNQSILSDEQFCSYERSDKVSDKAESEKPNFNCLQESQNGSERRREIKLKEKVENQPQIAENMNKQLKISLNNSASTIDYQSLKKQLIIEQRNMTASQEANNHKKKLQQIIKQLTLTRGESLANQQILAPTTFRKVEAIQNPLKIKSAVQTNQKAIFRQIVSTFYAKNARPFLQKYRGNENHAYSLLQDIPLLKDFLESLKPYLWDDLANENILGQFLQKLMPILLVNYHQKKAKLQEWPESQDWNFLDVRNSYCKPNDGNFKKFLQDPTRAFLVILFAQKLEQALSQGVQLDGGLNNIEWDMKDDEWKWIKEEALKTLNSGISPQERIVFGKHLDFLLQSSAKKV